MSRILSLAFTCALFVAAVLPASAQNVNVRKLDDGRVRVTIGDQLFTELITTGHSKPILYPVLGPHQIAMTRQWPIEEAATGEATDHPHQKSLWFTHGLVNGVDFWAEYDHKTGEPAPDRFGRIVQTKLLETESGKQGTIKTANNWLAPSGEVLLTDTRTLTFHNLPRGRAIDITVALHASHGDVTFGETKEGTMGIRTHPALRLSGPVAKGKAVNNEGVTGKAIWGKQAKWVDYWAPIDGHTVGVAIFDHPDNPRHPTYWHARHYGLVAANPFGHGDFDKSRKDEGNFTIKSGQTVTFRYRFYFHEGDHQSADIPAAYAAFAQNR